MPLADRLVHSLAIVTPTDSGELDERGQPIAGEPTTETAQGFVYPKSSREIAQANEAGAELADTSVIFAIREVSPAAYIRFDPDDGVRYEVRGSERYDFGNDPLVLVHTRRIVVSTLPAEGS